MTDEEQEIEQRPEVRAHANLRLPHSDRAPRLPTAFVAENLQGWQLDDMVKTASLVVSEVVTNAVIHARSDAELLLERTPTALRISVIDHGEGLSPQREDRRGRWRPRPRHRRGAVVEVGNRANRWWQLRMGRARIEPA